MGLDLSHGLFRRTKVVRGAEGSRFNVVFKSYGKTTIRVFADDEVIGERSYN